MGVTLFVFSLILCSLSSPSRSFLISQLLLSSVSLTLSVPDLCDSAIDKGKSLTYGLSAYRNTLSYKWSASYAPADTLRALPRREVATTAEVLRRALHGMCSLGRHVIPLSDSMRDRWSETPCHVSGSLLMLQQILRALPRREVATTAVVLRRALHGICSLGRHVIPLSDTVQTNWKVNS
jgi:hypothetical protein